jgi:NAD(P) transhydrogenase
MLARDMRESLVPPDREHDLVIIGSGPAGEGAAMKASKDGASVVVIERAKEVGGGCVHWATIPSKALRHSVGQLLDLKKSRSSRSSRARSRRPSRSCCAQQKA